ncbi:hypothetical protein [Bacillus pinisoli]|uniref:hypothetical protein n=1 Tax=Bacillus pinisoli TaxID=2901866 RepID=UPI001FF3B7E2|nr:hypothetical protein [Bacillus pinisoli]
MKGNKRYVILMILLPWLTVPFLGRNTIKRFVPGASLMSLYVFLEGILAEKRKWWWFSFNVKPNVLAELPLILGPFFIGSFWILKYTFGNLRLYILVNLLVDSFFTYIGLGVLKKIGYASLIKLSKSQLSLLFLVKSIVMYSSQVLYERYVSPK